MAATNTALTTALWLTERADRENLTN